jgi:hypothetical protein
VFPHHELRCLEVTKCENCGIQLFYVSSYRGLVIAFVFSLQFMVHDYTSCMASFNSPFGMELFLLLKLGLPFSDDCNCCAGSICIALECFVLQ